MQAVAAAAPPLAGDAERRARAALGARSKPRDLDLGEARKMFAAMLADGRPAGTRMAAS